jgi:glycosyltransferase involved in cell wall biosynthesis
MKTTMVIPSYWAREAVLGTKATDAVYDHPTAVNEEGTLQRALESLAVLNDKDFDVVVIAAANAEDVEEKAEEKVSRLISSITSDVPIHLFSHSHLRQIHRAIQDAGGENIIELLSLRGYANIRNLCLFLPHLLGSVVAVLVDDDEVFEDPAFMAKAREYIGGTLDGDFVGAVAGYYLQPDGDWLLKREKRPWMEHWDQLDRMNESFERIIGKRPRLKETPFVFGGNMVIHAEVFKHIPFDPNVTRGEDIDFLINMKMFGYKFFLDNTLAIKHLPAAKSHPIWKQLREDICRFLRERAKLRNQEPLENMARVSAEELDPYPGAFLKDNLEEKIKKACTILADYYRAEGSEADAVEALKNIDIARIEAHSGKNPFRELLRTKKLWEEMMDFTAREEIRERLREILVSSQACC